MYRIVYEDIVMFKKYVFVLEAENKDHAIAQCKKRLDYKFKNCVLREITEE